jgi:hypothetical protein
MIDRTVLLKDVIQLRRKVEGVISSLEADLRKALTRLTMFELWRKIPANGTSAMSSSSVR